MGEVNTHFMHRAGGYLTGEKWFGCVVNVLLFMVVCMACVVGIHVNLSRNHGVGFPHMLESEKLWNESAFMELEHTASSKVASLHPQQFILLCCVVVLPKP